MANSIVKSQENKVAASTGKTMKDYIKSMEGEIAKADHPRGQRIQLEDIGDDTRKLLALIGTGTRHAIDVDIAEKHGELGIDRGLGRCQHTRAGCSGSDSA